MNFCEVEEDALPSDVIRIIAPCYCRPASINEQQRGQSVGRSASTVDWSVLCDLVPLRQVVWLGLDVPLRLVVLFGDQYKAKFLDS